MTDRVHKIAEVASRLEVDFAPNDLARVHRRIVDGVQRKRKKARLLRLALLAAVVFVIAGGAWKTRQHFVASGSIPAAAPSTDAPELVLPDGSSVELGTSAILSQRPSEGDSSVVFDLERGRARFSVVPGRARTDPFRVVAGAVTVEVVGTIFTVTREPTSVRVAVERGTVHDL